MNDRIRIQSFSVSNYRAFGPNSQTLDFRDATGKADPLVVFHGPNASGKSSALSAIEVFFTLLQKWAQRRVRDRSQKALLERWGASISPRDWHANDQREPVVLSATLEGLPAARVELHVVPAGNQYSISVQTEPALETPKDVSSLLDRLERSLGTQETHVFGLIDSLRRGAWLHGERVPNERVSLLSDRLTDRLETLQQSLDLADKSRWRSLTSLVGKFDTLAGHDIYFGREPGSNRKTILAERPGQAIFKLEELSSGEQQIFAVCASVVAVGSAIVAIQEPELNLSPAWQRLLRQLLREQLKSGSVHQLFLESHVPSFDGPEVVRFERTPSGVSVSRGPATPSSVDAEFREAATARGAKHQWVTADGYTRLPDEMLQELHGGRGGHVWFLKAGKRWEAWPEDELTAAFGGGEAEEDE